MHSFAAQIKRRWMTLLFVFLLISVSFIYSTHLELVLIPKGYDLLFHLGNVFALQVAFSFSHKSLASLAISPIIFHDYGYGTHLFYPPLAHFVPALIAFLLSKVGFNSTLLAIRLFSFLTILGSGTTMFYAAKKMTGNEVYASFAALLYLSAPYLQWDYYWRGGMSSSLCFVFLPILLLSLYYFTKEKFAPYFFTFVISMTSLVWTHMITAFYTCIIFMIAAAANFFLLKKKKAAFLSTLIAGLMIGIMTSPFWILLLQQQSLHTYVIHSSDYPFTIESIAHNTVPFRNLFDIQFLVWQWKIRNVFGFFNIITLVFLAAFVIFFKPISKTLKNSRFLYSLICLLIFLLAMVTTSELWLHLPHFFSYIQYPSRLLVQATPILALLITLPFTLIQKVTPKKIIVLGVLALSIVMYTFTFNNYQLFEIGKIDFTTFSILQATGVDQEYLPVNAKREFEPLEKRPRLILPLTNNETSTPSAQITTNETPYLLAKIGNNENKQTLFELPRLFYGGYDLGWQAENAQASIALPYDQSKSGLITTMISGNGMLEVQFTGGKWYWISCVSAVAVLGYLIWLLYRSIHLKKPVWFEK